MFKQNILPAVISAALSRYPTEEELNDYTTPLPWETSYYLIPFPDFMEPWKTHYGNIDSETVG